MQLAKRKRKDRKTGVVTEDRKFTLRFSDHVGREHSLALFERRAPSEAWAKRLQVLIDAKASGEHLRPDMVEWIGNINRSHLDSIIKWGIIDARRIASTVPIGEHVDAWERSLKNEGRGIRHLKNTITRVRTVFTACGIRRWSDIDARTVSNWLAEQREICDWASRTHLSYVQSLKQFCKWMMVNELAVQDPLISLRRVNSHVQKVNRGAFTIEQCRALVDAASKSTRKIQGVDGPTRALAYRIAIQTGLRLGEIADLKVSSIRWAGDKQPLTTINLKEDESKAGKSTGKKTVLPVRQELEPYLREAAAGRHARAYLLPNMWSPTARYGEGGPKDGAEMLRHDLALVGLPYIDENGERYDFHALRHTYVTLNMQSGMTLTEGMLLNRHADSKTTSGYMHTQIMQSLEALEKVPGLDGSDPQENDQSAEAPKMAAGAESMARPLARNGPEIPVDSSEESTTVTPPDGRKLPFHRTFQISRLGVRIPPALPPTFVRPSAWNLVPRFA